MFYKQESRYVATPLTPKGFARGQSFKANKESELHPSVIRALLCGLLGHAQSKDFAIFVGPNVDINEAGVHRIEHEICPRCHLQIQARCRFLTFQEEE